MVGLADFDVVFFNTRLGVIVSKPNLVAAAFDNVPAGIREVETVAAAGASVLGLAVLGIIVFRLLILCQVLGQEGQLGGQEIIYRPGAFGRVVHLQEYLLLHPKCPYRN